MKDLLIFNVDIYPDDEDAVKSAALYISDGLVRDIATDYRKYLDRDIELFDGQGMKLLPGFIDVHVHGGYGYDFLESPAEAVSKFSSETVKEGCTAYLASLVCDHHEILMSAMRQYRQLNTGKGAECLGVHMEGCYISPDYKAVMKAECIRKPSLQEFKELAEASNDHLVQMTIAPELPGALELIKYGNSHGVSMMMGHSAASCWQAQLAFEAGAKGITHLYNAMSQHQHRTPGLVTAAFQNPELLSELIVDGFHVHPDVVSATFRVLGKERIVLITDATLMRGMPDGLYHFSDYDVRKTGIKAQAVESGRISGSVIGMDDAVRNMISFSGCSLSDIVRMACMNPSIIAHCDQRKGKLRKGYDADCVLLDDDLLVRACFVKGRQA